MKEKILIVEDDKAILTGLKDLLASEQFEVAVAEDGLAGFDAYRDFRPDLILLDVMMPNLSGYDLCRKIRQSDSGVVIIMLTAKGQEIDKVVGLEIGADDYVVKPFGVNELLARIRANLRRSARAAKTESLHDSRTFKVCGWSVDTMQMTMKCEDKLFELSAKEFELLKIFLENQNKVLDRDFLLSKVWGIDYYGTTRTLDQYIVKLRKKFDEIPATENIIKTIHGVGYKFCC
ncbi:MAG: response regulator transcription factor [Spirochaetales bacterium]|nr:response regulator transcription factor [Spirochaetales bacterium]